MKMRHTGLLASAAAMLSLAAPVAAQVATNINPDTGRSGTGTMVGRVGQVFAIDGGRLRGGNLFHSFRAFDLGRGDTALWTRSSGDGGAIANVISRVTGGDPSRIHGEIATRGMPNADFFFINPAGIVFGAGAAVNVPGAAHFSATRSVRFADGKVMFASTASGSTLSSAPPAAFGFVGGEGGVEVSNVGGDFLAAGTALSLVGADISVRNAIFGAAGLDLVASPDGLVRIADSRITVAPAAGHTGGLFVSAGDVVIQASGLDAQSGGDVEVQAGSMTMLGDARLWTSTSAEERAGDITIAADRLRVGGPGRRDARAFSRGNIDSTALAGSSGGSGDVTIDSALVVLEHGGKISSQLGAGAGGGGGQVAIDAGEGRLFMRGGGIVSADTHGTGDSGGVQVKAGAIRLAGGAGIAASTRNGGKAGVIDIRAASVTVSDAAISSNSAGGGDAGMVRVDAGAIRLGENGRITTLTNDKGRGGLIDIKAGAITLANGGYIRSSAGVNSKKGADAGTIMIETDRLSIADESRITTFTAGRGNGGAIDIDAGLLVIDGAGPIDPATFARGNIDASMLAGSSGNGGSVSIAADRLVMRDGGLIAAQAQAGSMGKRAGRISIEAETIAMEASNVTAGTFADANAGDIRIQADRAVLRADHTNPENSNRSGIGSGTRGQGNGGTVLVRADSLTLDGSGVSSNTAGSGSGGAVRVNAAALDIVRGGSIAALTARNGDAGTVFVTSEDLHVHEGKISVQANEGSTGLGGKVEIRAGRMRVDALGRVEAFAGGRGDGGELVISADRLEVRGDGRSDPEKFNRGNIEASTLRTSTGDAGNVHIRAGELIMTRAGLISSQAETGSGGDGGQVTVNARTIDLRSDSALIAVSRGPGKAGDVEVNADSVTLDRAGILSGASAAGRAGAINVRTGTMNIVNNGKISAVTSGSGRAGNIDVEVRNLLINNGRINASAARGSTGNAGGISIKAESILVRGSIPGLGRVESFTAGEGNAGKIDIEAGRLEVIGAGLLNQKAFVRGNISTSALISSKNGVAGTVTVTAGELVLREGGSITSQTQERTNGRGGAVRIDADAVSISDQGLVSASTFGRGDAGDVRIFSDRVSLASNASISSAAGRYRGQSGRVHIRSGELTLESGASVQTASRNANHAGDIRVRSGKVTLDGAGAAISSTNDAVRGGAAGSILLIGDQVSLANGGTITTNSETGTAGTIGLRMPAAGILSLSGSGRPSVITTSSGTRTGGEISISKPFAIVLQGGEILALGDEKFASVGIASQFFIRSSDRLNRLEVDGTLALDSNVDNVSSGAEAAEATFLDASSVLRAQCASSQASGAVNELAIRPSGPYSGSLAAWITSWTPPPPVLEGKTPLCQ